MGENKPVSVLADRYASNTMRAIFAPEEKIIAERRYGWRLRVLKRS